MPMFRVEAEFRHPRIPTEVVDLGDNQVQVSGIEKVERACRHYDARNPDEASAKARADLEKAVRKFLATSVVDKPTEETVKRVMAEQVRITGIRRLSPEEAAIMANQKAGSLENIILFILGAAVVGLIILCFL